MSNKKNDQNNLLTLRNFSRAIAGPAACLISPKSLSILSYSEMILSATVRIHFNSQRVSSAALFTGDALAVMEVTGTTRYLWR